MNTVQKPTVTVVMPLYNKEVEVGRAVESVLRQSIPDFELIVVNDGSTDKGPEVVHSIDDPRIKIIDQKNAGVSAARNRGILNAKTDLIAFLDADDEWKPFFFETIFYLKKTFPTCKIFATNYVYREVNWIQRLPIIRGMPSHPWAGVLSDYFEIASKSDPPLCSSSVAISKESLESVGMFPVGVNSGEDLLTWAKLALKYKIAYTTKVCAVFYVPTSVFDRPGRFNDTSDVVGWNLINLFSEATSSESKNLRKYITLWYKNRTVTFLNFGENRKALEELQLMARFSKKTGKWYLYAFLANLPRGITRFLTKMLRKITRLRRDEMQV
ncbi:MAG: glycosyltransferase [Desulfobacteraceae bacterium]|nr:glycosyltransferase [Desulfobacteraceae bacterium]